MRYLKVFENFDQDIDSICSSYGIEDYEAENEGEQPTLYLMAINDFLKQIGKDPVTEVEGYNCE
jgi:hypothetical protein